MNEILTKAREILAPKGAWIQLNPAMDSRGNWRDPRDPRASCWCLVGALERATFEALGVLDEFLLDAAMYALTGALERTGEYPSDALAAWNDAPSRTHEEVLQLIDRAIAA